jgi:hypothetical protein
MIIAKGSIALPYIIYFDYVIYVIYFITVLKDRKLISFTMQMGIYKN